LSRSRIVEAFAALFLGVAVGYVATRSLKRAVGHLRFGRFFARWLGIFIYSIGLGVFLVLDNNGLHQTRDGTTILVTWSFVLWFAPFWSLLMALGLSVDRAPWLVSSRSRSKDA
jgi:hypothetical protein